MSGRFYGNDSLSRAEESLLKELVSELGIKTENIFHFTLSNGAEFIGEVVEETDTNEYVTIHPIKVLKEFMVNKNKEMVTHIYYSDWNLCAEGPFFTLNDSAVIAISPINRETLMTYVIKVCDFYYEGSLVLDGSELLDDEFNDILLGIMDVTDVEKTNRKGNVVDFISKLKQREQEKL